MPWAISALHLFAGFGGQLHGFFGFDEGILKEIVQAGIGSLQNQSRQGGYGAGGGCRHGVHHVVDTGTDVVQGIGNRRHRIELAATVPKPNCAEPRGRAFDITPERTAYRWTNEDGVASFGDEKPKNGSSQPIQLDNGPRDFVLHITTDQGTLPLNFHGPRHRRRKTDLRSMVRVVGGIGGLSSRSHATTRRGSKPFFGNYGGAVMHFPMGFTPSRTTRSLSTTTLLSCPTIDC